MNKTNWKYYSLSDQRRDRATREAKKDGEGVEQEQGGRCSVQGRTSFHSLPGGGTVWSIMGQSANQSGQIKVLWGDKCFVAMGQDDTEGLAGNLDLNLRQDRAMEVKKKELIV